MRRSPLAVVYLTVFIDLLGFSIILPLLPFYAEHYGATGVWVGALLSAYSAVQFVSAPILGRVSDRVGRRPVLLASLAGSAASLALTGAAHSLWLLLAGRALAGLFGGSIATGQAYVADVTKPADRAKYMGLLGACIGLGFVFGPAIGAGLSPLGFGAAAFFAAGLAAFNFGFAWFRLPESRPAAPIPRGISGPRMPGEGETNPRGIGAVGAVRRWRRGRLGALRRPALGRYLAAIFLTNFAFVGLEATFALFSEKQWGLDAAGFALLFTYIGVIVIVVQGGLIGRLRRRHSEGTLATAGAGLLALMLLLLAVTPNLAFGLLVLTGLGLGQGLVSPMLSTLISHAAGADEQGGTLGLGQSFAAAARAVGPLAAGGLYDLTRSLPYLVGAALTLGAALLLSQAAVAARARDAAAPIGVQVEAGPPSPEISLDRR
ncbi:MAG TPA: MFS transporter [Dehalococcoidia bacterium]|nr:MFS transporter [Dehalococcoidia bacterium]